MNVVGLIVSDYVVRSGTRYTVYNASQAMPHLENNAQDAELKVRMHGVASIFSRMWQYRGIRSQLACKS